MKPPPSSRWPRHPARSWPHGSGKAAQPPEWWPPERSWPPAPGPGAQAWSNFGRLVFRIFFVLAAVALIVPFLVVAAITFSSDGWSTLALIGAGWLLLAVAVLTILRVTFRTAVPVGRLIVAAGRLADGDYAARVENSTSRTVQPVVESFNRMAQQLENAHENRRQLLADINHELRTPLTVLRGELEAIADGVRPATPTQIRILLDDIAVVERLLGDLQTLSVTEDGRLALRTEPTNVAELAADVVRGLAGDAQADGVALRAVTTGGSEELVIDPIRIREVISNLVLNALRAAGPGDEVIVETSTITSDGGLIARIEVRDSGAGIAPEKLPHVFERFAKGAGSSGSGLGLTISKRLVEAHGGTIEIDSVPAEGTTVRVNLPDGDPDRR